MSKLEVDAIEPQSGTTLTLGASGDSVNIASGASFASIGIDDNADATAITIDSSERVGIGTASPDCKLKVDAGTTASIFSPAMILTSSTGGAGGATPIDLRHSTNSSSGFRIQIAGSAGSNNATLNLIENSAMIFATNNNERMRIDSSGNVLVGTTTASGKLFSSTSSSSQPALRAASTSATYADNVFVIDVDRNTTNNTFYAITYYNNGASAFKFRVADSGNVTNANNSYGSISDIKLKENIVDATPKLEKLKQVRIVNFNFINDNQKQIGVIAQELENTFPSMVEESPDKDKDGNDLGTTTKQVKYSVFVPILIKALQEAITKIEDLEARITALENNQP